MKTANKKYIEAMRQIRRSNATVPIPSGKAYTRKTKHKGKQYDR